MQQHPEAIDARRALQRRLFGKRLHQRRLPRLVNEVDHGGVPKGIEGQPTNEGLGRRIVFPFGDQGRARRLNEKGGSGEGPAERGLLRKGNHIAGKAGFREQGFGGFGPPGSDGDGHAPTRQTNRCGPGGSTGAEDQRMATQRHPFELKGAEQPGGIRVQPEKLLPAANDGVHRADAPGRLVDLVEERQDRLFVGQGHVHPSDPEGPKTSNRCFELAGTHRKPAVVPFDAQMLERRVVHRRGTAVFDGPADDACKLHRLCIPRRFRHRPGD